MHFMLAAGERPQQPRLILFVGEGLKKANLFNIQEFRQYMPEVKWDRTRHNPDDTFDKTQMRYELGMWSLLATNVSHFHYLICPETLSGSEAEGIMTVLEKFKEVLSETSKPYGPLSVVTLSAHLAKEVIRFATLMGFGSQILVLHFPKEGSMSMGWVEQEQQFVANQPFSLEANTLSAEQMSQLGLAHELI